MRKQTLAAERHASSLQARSASRRPRRHAACKAQKDLAAPRSAGMHFSAVRLWIGLHFSCWGLAADNMITAVHAAQQALHGTAIVSSATSVPAVRTCGPLGAILVPLAATFEGHAIITVVAIGVGLPARQPL